MPGKAQSLKRGMMVNAYDCVTGKKAIGSPIELQRIGSKQVGGIDCDDNARTFVLNNWRIEVL